METVFTRHAKARMRWRKISKEEIDEILAAPDRKEFIGSNRLHYFRRMGKRNLRVTCVIEERKLVIVSVVDKSN